MPQRGKVLLIGDSISLGYLPQVASELAGEFVVRRNEGNAGDSGRLLAGLDGFLAADGDADVVHFNCGLHDIKRLRDAGGPQVPLPEYRRNLPRIIRRLKRTGRKLIWASTTPVIYERHAAVKGFDRLEEDVVAYNHAAAEIVAAAGIPIDDLYAGIVSAGVAGCVGPDGVHMTEEGNAVLGKAVAAAVREHFGR